MHTSLSYNLGQKNNHDKLNVFLFVRIGLAEQSVLQALAQACLQTPLLQAYPPPIHTAFKSADNDAFKVCGFSRHFYAAPDDYSASR